MSIRNRAFVAGVVAAAAVAGVATSQQQPPSPVAATQTSLPRTRADNAALAQARQDPVSARLRGALNQNKGLTGLLQQVDASPVPVLAPAEMGLLDTAEFTTRDRVYMLTIQRGEQIIEIYGSVKAYQSPLAAPAAQAAATTAPRGPRMAAARVPDAAGRALAQARARGLTNIRTERTEYGVDVTFNRFGAAYNVSFLCEGAPNCTEADAVAFAAGLQLIGGGAS
ncbi:hypothetical protein [Brevundimonas sp. LjRoot202]|uniref:hypothetical protein n=1 Tax=Brevundimonas sp. LjRoot202 TaxID=3342281 RepID=UPI003ECD05CA